MNSELSFQIGNFDGPLDLLLKLINRHKIDIYDIPIAFIFAQYMQQIEVMKDREMDVASEFITMASELMLIKSRMLLPKVQIGEEEDPREQLAKTLEAYKRAKEASGKLSSLFSLYGSRMVKETDEIEIDKTAVNPQSLQSLFNAFERVLIRQNILEQAHTDRPKAQLVQIVNIKATPIPVMAINILRRLVKKKICTFENLLEDCKSKSDILSSFMAILQLLSKRQITIQIYSEIDKNQIIFTINKDEERKNLCKI